MPTRVSIARATFGGFGALLALVVTGCGGGLSPIPVSGTVTHKGKPVEGATVTFVRGTGSLTNGEMAMGVTDASGRYELTSHFGPQTSGSGAVAGEYKVTVSKLVPPNGMTDAQYKVLTDAAARASERGAALPPERRPPPLAESLPPKYSSQTTTQLNAKVGGGGEINFALD